MPTSKVVHVRMKDHVLVACLEFVVDKSSVSDAVRRTLETFIILLQKQGKLAVHTDEEVTQILMDNKLIVPEEELVGEQLPDLTEILKQTQEVHTPYSTGSTEQPDFTAMAEEAERRIREQSVPQVRQQFEQVDEVDKPKTLNINLLGQPRVPFAILKKRAPKDRFIEQVSALYLKKGELSDNETVFIAAVEVAYTNLPQDLWGSERALTEINELIKMHKGE